jgi:large subunit ribosomal protein L23
MKLQDPHKIITKPIITEKASRIRTEENAYSFYVNKLASKEDVKKSVEKLFNVSVIDIRVINEATKPRRRGKAIGRTHQRKKAIVKLKAGHTIPIFEGIV